MLRTLWVWTKSMTTYIHHYNVAQSTFTAHENFCTLYSPLCKLLTTTDLFIVSTVLPFPEYQAYERTTLEMNLLDPFKPLYDCRQSNILTATSWETLSQKDAVKILPDFWLIKYICYYFKLLNFNVIAVYFFWWNFLYNCKLLHLDP